jgi:hypothetical protein
MHKLFDVNSLQQSTYHAPTPKNRAGGAWCMVLRGGEKTLSADNSRQNAIPGRFAAEFGHAKTTNFQTLPGKDGRKRGKNPEKQPFFH